MTPVAVLANDHFTSSSATTLTPAARVIYLGAFSACPAENIMGLPEEAIDYGAAAATLLAASDVDEHYSSSVDVSSPFGI